MELTKEWLDKLNKVKKLLQAPSDYNNYFEKDEIMGRLITRIDMGTVTMTNGAVVVRDPLVYLDKTAEPYFKKVPCGEFPVTCCVMVETEEDCDRYAAVKVEFTKERAVSFENAMIGSENLDGLKEGDFFGFNVDAGLGAVTDTIGRDAYIEFVDKWEEENSDGNIYDDYFAELFEKNFIKYPNYQRSGGDWINFNIPNTKINIPIFQSGYGDGSYPVYYGFDKNGDICSLIIEFINIEILVEEEDDYENE